MIAEPSEVILLVEIDLDIVILVDFGRLVSVDDPCPYIKLEKFRTEKKIDMQIKNIEK
jgi:hypothetical protein